MPDWERAERGLQISTRRGQLGNVPDALIALGDALDDPVTLPAVRSRALTLAMRLDAEGREHLATFLYELADAFA